MAVDAQRIYLSAESFRVSAETLAVHHTKENRFVFLIPIFVFQAFACELYLKCLLAIKTPQLPKTHRLHKLFATLPRTVKALVVRRYKELSKHDKEHMQMAIDHPEYKNDLMSVLEDGSEVFEKLRYAYEGIEGMKMRASFKWPIHAIRAVILEAHPEWPRL